MNALKGTDPAWALRLAPIVGLVALFGGSWFVVDAMGFTGTFPLCNGTILRNG